MGSEMCIRDSVHPITQSNAIRLRVSLIIESSGKDDLEFNEGGPKKLRLRYKMNAYD